MKVLLLEDVDNLGLAGAVVTVPGGYGRNYLIPRKLAKVATEGAMKESDIIAKAGERKRARQLGAAQVLAKQLEETTLQFTARAGETGKLYGSITTAELAEALEARLGVEIDRRKIISDPLRQLGEHEVEIRLMAGVAPKIKVIVESEAGEEQAEMEPVAEIEEEVVEAEEQVELVLEEDESLVQEEAEEDASD